MSCAQPGWSLLGLLVLVALAGRSSSVEQLHRSQGRQETLDLGEEVPAPVSEAFRVAGEFDKMASASMSPPRLPQEDIMQLTMTPLEGAEQEALRGLHDNGDLGDSAPDTTEGGKRPEEKTPIEKEVSKGTLLRAYGAFSVMDYVTQQTKKENDRIYEQKAADYAADINSPIREELMTASLLETNEGVSDSVTWAGRRRRGVPDPGEEQKRPGWTKRIPGIEEKVDTADYFTGGDSAQTFTIPDISVEEAKKLTEKKADAQTPRGLKAAPRSYGCFADGDTERVLPYSMGDGAGGDWTTFRGVMGGLRPSDMEPTQCARLCQKYNLMGLQTIGDTTFCYCGDKVGAAERVAESDCHMPCAGNPGMTCGAPLRVSVFSLEKNSNEVCWDGSRSLDNTDKPWHQYRQCATCISGGLAPGEKWQLWGNQMEMALFAVCLSCEADAAFVMLDPIKRNGFCRDYNPAADKIITYTYPYFAHWDGMSEFVHTKFVRKYTVPKIRGNGKAAASCRLWKQVRCELSQEAKLRNWQHHMTRDNQLSEYRSRSEGVRRDKELAQKEGVTTRVDSLQRFLQCHTSKLVKCEKVCVAHPDNLGRDPKKTQAHCGAGGIEYAAGDQGLEAELGKAVQGLNGIWCCYQGCQVPPEHAVYKEDGSFWCKDEVASW